MFAILGEALIDMVVEGDGGTLTAHYGGGPFNTAVALARLDAPTCYHFPLSHDYYGTQLASYLTKNGVRYTCPYVSQKPTPLAIVRVDNNNKAQYQFYRHGTAERDLQQADLLDALPKNTRVIHTGTLAIADRQDATYIKHILLQAKKQQILISVDPNIRANCFTDHNAYRTNVLNILEEADIIKLSDEDASFLYPDVPLDSMLPYMRQQYPAARLLVITAGPHSIVASSKQHQVNVKPQAKTTTGDTIGAGDSFIAGLLYACYAADALKVHGLDAVSSADLTKIVTIADAVAGLNCQKKGCNPPSLAELQSYLITRGIRT